MPQQDGAGQEEAAGEPQGFRIGGGGERAKGGLEVVHVLQGGWGCSRVLRGRQARGRLCQHGRAQHACCFKVRDEPPPLPHGFRCCGGGCASELSTCCPRLPAPSRAGLGPPAQLEDGSAGVAPHPGGQGAFAAAAKAEHTSEADLFRRMLLGRGAP